MSRTVVVNVVLTARAEGEVIAYNYTEIDDNGQKILDNERRSFIVTDETIEQKIKGIRAFVLEKHLR